MSSLKFYIVIPAHNEESTIGLTLESLTQQTSNDTVGIAGGLVFIEKNNRWIYENIASKQHVRGPVKAYRKGCFKAIGGLRASIGWDTVDTLLAKYHKWSVVTDTSLSVKHLKSTGNTYTKRSKYLQGEALYKMRYGFWVMLITALKIAFKKRSFMIFINYIKGYYKAKSNRYDFLVSEKEGQFIRRLRWQGIWKAIGL